LIQFIVFSRKRPLQLHGYLTSLFANCVGDFKVSVLLNAETPYYRAYSEVSDEFPQVGFAYESQFVEQLPLLVDTEAEFTCFGCDDVVWATHIEPDAIGKVLTEKPELLGVSLRLGENIHADMFGGSLPQPAFTDQSWDMTAPTSTGDWAYPWEVLGTVYRTEFVTRVVAGLGARSPSQLEERGSREWSKYTTLHHMASYPTSRLVVPTVNVIQTEFPGNGIRGAQPLSPEFLLDCWHNGLRLDTERYAAMTPDSWRIGDFYLRRAQ
jgi:hypothetical protein